MVPPPTKLAAADGLVKSKTFSGYLSLCISTLSLENLDCLIIYTQNERQPSREKPHEGAIELWGKRKT